jgi:thioredoxin reductase (NADPH)
MVFVHPNFDPMPSSALLDCLIIGGGAAGLVASTYLSRFRRSVKVLDSSQSRLLWIPTSHNYPGFAQGIHGRDILARLRAQAVEYGVEMIDGRVDHLSKRDDGVFVAQIADRQFEARTVILATGVVDIAPEFPGAAEAITAGNLRFCPICDGYESIGRCTAVVGNGNGGINEALFIRHFAEDLSLLTIGAPFQPSAEQQETLDAIGVRIIESAMTGLSYRDDKIIEVQFEDGSARAFDVVYAALGTKVNSELAQAIGARCEDDGAVIVDDHMNTSVDGLYAAGDLVSALNQITVAMGHAAIAATAIHNRLR